MNKFKIGDEVYTQRIGNPLKGTIRGLLVGTLYAQINLSKTNLICYDNGQLLISSNHP